MHASCESPWHSLAKRHLLRACFPRMAPFRSMLLTLRGGPESLAPRAHQIPVYLMVFSTFLCRAFTAHGAVMVRDPFAIIAIDAPDSDRRAHHVLGHVARQALVLRRHFALLHVRHQTIWILPETQIDQTLHRIRLKRLAKRVHQVPLPLVTQELVRQKTPMLPALRRRIIATTGGDQVQVRVVLTVTPVCMDHGDVAPPERLAPDLAIKSVQALHPASHQRAHQHRGVLVKDRAKHRRDREDDVPIDHTLVQDLAHLAHPGVHGDFGTPQAQRRFAAHCHPMGALATLQAAVLDIAHLVRVATRQHLGHEAIVVGGLIPRMGALKRVPALGKDLLEDTPVPRGLWHHRGAPSWGDELLTVQRLYHASSASSTPHRPVLGQPSLASFILESRGLPGSGKCKILCYELTGRGTALQLHASRRPYSPGIETGRSFQSRCY